MNEQRKAIIKAYKLKVEQEVILSSPQQPISTYGPVRNESPKMLDKHVGVIRYSKPPDSTKVNPQHHNYLQVRKFDISYNPK